MVNGYLRSLYDFYTCYESDKIAAWVLNNMHVLQREQYGSTLRNMFIRLFTMIRFFLLFTSTV